MFEPNDEPTWARVRRSVSDFLTGLWMDGMLQGANEGGGVLRALRPHDDDAGRHRQRPADLLIGIAPVKPAEFVIFRIGQWTGGSDVSEASRKSSTMSCDGKRNDPYGQFNFLDRDRRRRARPASARSAG